MMPAHSISTATVYMAPVKNAALLLDVAETGFVKPAEAAMAPNKVVYPCWSAAIENYFTLTVTIDENGNIVTGDSGKTGPAPCVFTPIQYG